MKLFFMLALLLPFLATARLGDEGLTTLDTDVAAREDTAPKDERNLFFLRKFSCACFERARHLHRMYLISWFQQFSSLFRRSLVMDS